MFPPKTATSLALVELRDKCSSSAARKIVSGGLLAPEGMVIVERSAQIPLAPIKGLYVDREKNYKTTVITFLRPEESAT